MAKHILTYVNSGTWEHPCTVNDDGDIVVDWEKIDFLDVDETSLWCSECGRVGVNDESIHRLNEEWQAL